MDFEDLNPGGSRIERAYVAYLNADLKDITQAEVDRRLTLAGLVRGVRDTGDYSIAKRVLVHGEIINSEIYDRVIELILNFLED